MPTASWNTRSISDELVQNVCFSDTGSAPPNATVCHRRCCTQSRNVGGQSNSPAGAADNVSSSILSIRVRGRMRAKVSRIAHRIGASI